MIPFKLEEFFDHYEHRSGLINLASSDALPWSVSALHDKGISLSEDRALTLGYPDVNSRLLPGLIAFCNPPHGIELLPTSGAAEAIALVLHEYSDARVGGGELTVGIPSPSYGAFRGLAELLRLPTESYTYDPSSGWVPNHEELLRLSRRCGALIVTNPHNPTGHAMPLELLRRLADECAAHDGILIVDEVFRVPQETPSAIQLAPHVVVIGSLSKTYGLPGLRLGWVAARRDRLPRLRTVQHYLTLSLSTATATLGAAILNKHEAFSRADLISANRAILMDWAGALQDIVSISAPLGGTTVCLTLRFPGDETTLFKRFLDVGVLLAPGIRCFEFAQDAPWFRLGYATGSEALREGLNRIADVLQFPSAQATPG